MSFLHISQEKLERAMLAWVFVFRAGDLDKIPVIILEDVEELSDLLKKLGL